MRFPGRARALVFAVVASLVAGCPNGAGITCPSGQTLCNGSCTFVANDPQNCGVCGKACPGSLICISGSCGCPPEQLACADVCVDSKVDPNNCGDCGVSCVSGQLCSGGSCALIGTNEHCIGCMPCPPNGFCFTMGSGLGNMCGAG
jgi:Stigma-specific protein, Stig1